MVAKLCCVCARDEALECCQQTGLELHPFRSHVHGRISSVSSELCSYMGVAELDFVI
jgi:hypothetical protein